MPPNTTSKKRVRVTPVTDPERLRQIRATQQAAIQRELAEQERAGNIQRRTEGGQEVIEARTREAASLARVAAEREAAAEQRRITEENLARKRERVEAARAASIEAERREAAETTQTFADDPRRRILTSIQEAESPDVPSITTGQRAASGELVSRVAAQQRRQERVEQRLGAVRSFVGGVASSGIINIGAGSVSQLAGREQVVTPAGRRRARKVGEVVGGVATFVPEATATTIGGLEKASIAGRAAAEGFSPQVRQELRSAGVTAGRVVTQPEVLVTTAALAVLPGAAAARSRRVTPRPESIRLRGVETRTTRGRTVTVERGEFTSVRGQQVRFESQTTFPTATPTQGRVSVRLFDPKGRTIQTRETAIRRVVTEQTPSRLGVETVVGRFPGGRKRTSQLVGVAETGVRQTPTRQVSDVTLEILEGTSRLGVRRRTIAGRREVIRSQKEVTGLDLVSGQPTTRVQTGPVTADLFTPRAQAVTTGRLPFSTLFPSLGRRGQVPLALTRPSVRTGPGVPSVGTPITPLTTPTLFTPGVAPVIGFRPSVDRPSTTVSPTRPSEEPLIPTPSLDVLAPTVRERSVPRIAPTARVTPQAPSLVGFPSVTQPVTPVRTGLEPGATTRPTTDFGPSSDPGALGVPEAPSRTGPSDDSGAQFFGFGRFAPSITPTPSPRVFGGGVGLPLFGFSTRTGGLGRRLGIGSLAKGRKRPSEAPTLFESTFKLDIKRRPVGQLTGLGLRGTRGLKT